ncbi:MAG: glycosyltransferase family 4 protein [Dehalococcoidia bacterium]
MRIAIVTDYYYPALGGITEHVHGQAMSLHRRGHEVTVITGNVFRPPKVTDPGYAPEKDVPFEIIRMGLSVSLYGNGAQTLNTVHPLMYWKLKKLFRERRFDVIHTHAPYNPSFVQVVPFVAPKRSVTVGTFHSVFPKTLRMNLAGPLLRPSIARLDGRIVVSEACIDSLKPYFPFEYTVIPNGIDETHFTPCAEPFPELKDGRQNILYLGRFDPRNGLDTTIKAFTKLRRERGDTVRLIVVGDGPLRPYYARMVPEDVAPSVVWAGRVNWDRPRYFASADVLCTPCERASFGMVLLESMSCGVPVVASRISGFQLVMEHEKQGLMIPEATDANAFAEGLTTLLDSAELRRCMGAEGRRTAAEHYSWTSLAERLERYYCGLLSQRRGA